MRAMAWPWLWAAATAGGGHPSVPTKPNILVVIADDAGYNGVGYMNRHLNGPDAPALITPHLDRFAAEGVKLGAFYVQPLCAPTRSAFMFGRYPIRLGTTAYNPDWGKPWGVDLEEVTVAQTLKAAGYTTGLFGKWHLGCHNVQYLPTSRGFDVYSGFLTGGLTHFSHDTAVYSYPPSAQFPHGCDHCVVGYDWHNGSARRGLSPAFRLNGTYSAVGVRDAAADFVVSAPTDAPWFAVAAFQDVHEPLECPPEFVALYSHLRLHSDRVYAGMMSALDVGFGGIVAAVNKTGRLNNTLIIFFSDNGALASATAPFGRAAWFKGGKTQTTEGGTRVPAFVWFPTALKPSWHNGLFHVVDLLPTIAALAGANTNASRPLDGVNIFSALQNGSASPRTEMLYNINPRADNNDQLKSPKASIRVGYWKLSYTFWHNKTTPQLYNLSADPMEADDVSKAFPKVVALLTGRLETYAADLVPPYQPWPPWQGAAYRCCACNESWAQSFHGSPLVWQPWVHDLPAVGKCTAPYPTCVIPPCYGH